ncbi:MAG: hypothetical protein SGPRY_012666, partial [Prymnesium sp.]
AVSRLLSRAEQRTLAPADPAMVEAAVAKLSEVELNGEKAAGRIILEASHLIADALQELRESEAEAAAEEHDDDDERSLLAVGGFGRGVVGLVAAALDLLRLSSETGLPLCAADERAMLMLVTCAQAASEQVDSLACAAYEGSVTDVLSYASSLCKLMKKLGDIISRAGMEEDAVLHRHTAEVERCFSELQGEASSLLNE